MHLWSSRLCVTLVLLISISGAIGCMQSSPTTRATVRPDVAATVTAAEPTAAEVDDVAADGVAADDIAGDGAVREFVTTKTSGPQKREAAKPVVGEYGADVPPVLLSSGHAKLCKVKVGDEFPALQLPALAEGSSEIAYGPKATVILFWTTDRWMSGSALHDLASLATNGVSVVGVAVGGDKAAATKLATDAGAKFVLLSDADGAAFSQFGEGKLPRVYVLDPQKHIAWFDIEYSEATRRELQQTLAALAR